MAKLFVSTVLIIISSSSVAAEDWRGVCSSMGSYAETVMKKRQEGISMAKMIGAIDDTEAKDMAERIVILAYDEPRYATAPMQERSVEEFRDQIYLECVKKFRPNT